MPQTPNSQLIRSSRRGAGFPTSTKLTTSSLPRRASTDCLPTVNSAPLRLSPNPSREGSSTKYTSPVSSSAEEITPRTRTGNSFLVSTVKFKTVLEFFHLTSLENASAGEAIFLHTLYRQLAIEARTLAAIFPYSVQRPLQALFAAMRKPGRNCKATNAKRKRGGQIRQSACEKPGERK